ncbi:unnamed protein product [marine sediment metagenome]|uniref:Uncharacterized protein n=1 Tax=marine sediment metagenome TaxID=412755 RepID=X1ITL9_9ZZZZ
MLGGHGGRKADLTAYVGPDLSSSGGLTVSGSVRTGAGELGGMIISTDGTTNVRAELYDTAGEAPVGTLLIPALGVKTDWYAGGALFPFTVPFQDGVYLNIVAGAGANQKICVYSRSV